MEFELRYNVDGAVCSVGRCVLDEINVFTVSSLVYVYIQYWLVGQRSMDID